MMVAVIVLSIFCLVAAKMGLKKKEKENCVSLSRSWIICVELTVNINC